MDFAGEIGSLTLSGSALYTGDFSNAGNLTVTINGGTLTPGDTSTVSFGSLYVASGGTLGVYVDGGESSTFNVTSATLEDGASITATVNDLANVEGTYTVLTADSLDLEGSLTSSLDLPFIYDGDVTTDANRSEEHTSELQSLMRISYAVFCLKNKNKLFITTHQ